MLGRYTVPVRLHEPGPGRRQLADPGPVSPLGLAGGRGPGGRRGRPPGAGRAGSGSAGRPGSSAAIVAASAAILACDLPARPGPSPGAGRRPSTSEHFRWLGRELAIGVGRTAVLVAGGLGPDRAGVARSSSRAPAAGWRPAVPLLVIADLLGSHSRGRPDDRPELLDRPARVGRARIQADPGAIRVFGVAEKSAAEPGFASRAGRLLRGPRPARLEPPAGLGPAGRRWGTRRSTPGGC